MSENHVPGWSNSSPDSPERVVSTALAGDPPAAVTVKEPTAPTKAARKAPAKKTAGK